eukprot:TRINITY_DN14738_c0_g1_i1.p1 TRINITY_DN14738_c0_g1~~TRINITY_DN14738_c0_g1_i1.p1  ORF type:complete len:784 (+),score=179.94 TRINITY_DN14738_c0_g1_i1:51-2354(+)
MQAPVPLEGLLSRAARAASPRAAWVPDGVTAEAEEAAADALLRSLKETGWAVLSADSSPAASAFVSSVTECRSKWVRWSDSTTEAAKDQMMRDFMGEGGDEPAGLKAAMERGCGWSRQELRQQWHCEDRDAGVAPWPAEDLRRSSAASASDLRALLSVMVECLADSGMCSAAATAVGRGADGVRALSSRTGQSVLDYFCYHSRESDPPGAPTMHWPVEAGHVDPGFLTVLPLASVPGIEFRQPDGDWIAVEEGATRPGLAVFGGSLLEAVTAGQVRAVYHRVSRRAGQPQRHSLVYELRADSEQVYAAGVRPVPLCAPAPGRGAAAAAALWKARVPPETWLVRTAQQSGRGAVAMRDLVAGETILWETPAAHAVEYGLPLCTVCARDCEVACKCGMLRVCPNEPDHDAHDEAECAALSHFTPPTSLACILRLVRALQDRPAAHTPAPSDVPASDLTVPAALPGLVAQLETHRAEMGTDQLSGHQHNATILQMICKSCSTEVDPRELEDLLMKLAVNGIPPRSAGSAPHGAALYPLAAVLNHSCSPNLELEIGEGFELRAVTTRAVKAGEDLCISYSHGWGTRETRRASLFANYFFHCRCDRCEVGDTAEEEQWAACSCPVCGKNSSHPIFAPDDLEMCGPEPDQGAETGGPHDCALAAARAMQKARDELCEATTSAAVVHALRAARSVASETSIALANFHLTCAEIYECLGEPQGVVDCLAAALHAYTHILSGKPSHKFLGQLRSRHTQAMEAVAGAAKALSGTGCV